MRIIFVIPALFLALSNTSSAAETQWTGYHIGVSGNSSRSDKDTFSDVTVIVDAPGPGPVVIEPRDLGYGSTGYGIEGGYLYEFPNGFVIGADIKYETIGVTDGNNDQISENPIFLPQEDPVGVSIDRSFSVRARAGFSYRKVLLYVGPEFVRSDLSLKSFYSDPFFPSMSASAVGSAKANHIAMSAGVDWKLSRHWSIGLDYRDSSAFKADFDLDQNSYIALFQSRPAEAVTRLKYRNINYQQFNVRVSFYF